ncbi:MAG: hypothetical protein WC008_00120 [Bacilli bacterium]|jgi:hypothetical protein
MIIRPSTLMRNNYKEISKLAKKTKGPIYLTKNGKGDLMVMDIDAFVERENLINFHEKLLISEINHTSGNHEIPLDKIKEKWLS